METTGCCSELSRMVLEDPAAVANKIVQKEKKRPNKHNYSLSTALYQPPRSGDLGFATQLEQRGWARRRLGTTAPYLPRAWVMASGPPYNLIKQIRLTEPPGWLDLPASEGSLRPRQEQKPPGYSSLARSGPASSRGLGGLQDGTGVRRFCLMIPNCTFHVTPPLVQTPQGSASAEHFYFTGSQGCSVSLCLRLTETTQASRFCSKPALTGSRKHPATSQSWARRSALGQGWTTRQLSTEVLPGTGQELVDLDSDPGSPTGV